MCVVWDQRDRQAEGKENDGKETGENVPCRHCVFGSSRRRRCRCCLSQWLLQRLPMVVEWSGRAGQGMVWYGVLWWWKLCVFLCHIPIYINLVFAMTDDICQCQTFSFSISASPLSLSFALSGSARQGRASPGFVVGLKVTFPKVSPAQRPRFQNIRRPLANHPSPPHPSPPTSSPAPFGKRARPTHEFDEFDVKYFRCFPHFFYEKHFLGIRIGFWARLPRALASQTPRG